MVTRKQGHWTVGIENRRGRVGHRVRFSDRPSATAYEQYVKLRRREGKRLKYILRRACHTIWHGSRNERNCVSNTEEIIEFFGPDNQPDAITSAAVSEFILYLRDFRRNKPGTINRKLATLNRLVKFLRDEDAILRLPTVRRLREQESRIRFLSLSEEKRLFSELKGKSGAHAAFAAFLLYTGARFGEARSVTWDDIAADRVTFWNTKSRHARTIPLVKQARQAIAKIRKFGWDEPFKHINPAGFRSDWQKAVRAAGFERDRHLVPHVLRHTCASRLVQGNADILRVKDWLGHSSVVLTMRYAHLAPHDLFDIAPILERRRRRR